LQLEAADAAPVLIHINYDASWTTYLFLSYSITADMSRYAVTLISDSVTLTFDLEHVQCIASDMT